MSRVTLIGTVHEELGIANVSELHAILEIIRPDAIFMELPPGAFDENFQIFRHANLETAAISQYRKGHKVALLPVDLPTPDSQFFENFNRFQNTLKANNPIFREMLELDSRLISTRGFLYLNSVQCDNHWEAFYTAMHEEVELLDDPALRTILESWIQTHDRREFGIMKNIVHYCSQYTYTNPVLLIGAAHRRQIIKKSKPLISPDSIYIEWNLFGS